MSAYMYKVTAKRKTLPDGSEANVAVYAYKPYHGYGTAIEKMNRELHRTTGCYNAERYAKNGKTYTGLVVLEENDDVAVAVKHGTFTDYWFDKQLEEKYKKSIAKM